MADKQKDTRSAEEIQRSLASMRARVAANVEQLVEEVHPSTIADNAKDQAKAFVRSEFTSARQTIKDHNGWRVDRLLAIGAAVCGVVATLLTLQNLVDRGQSRRTLRSLRNH